MLFYNVFCVCFLALLAPKIETNADFNSETEKPETLFADVIKNISRVNNELQDLINNYEQFKKARNSLENFDDNESDADGGRVNRNSKNSVGNKRSNKTSTTVQYQTEMIYDEEEEEEENSSEPEKSIETEISKSEHNNEVDKSHEVESRKPMAKTDKYKLKVQKTTTQASIANEEPKTLKEETEPEHKKVKIKTDRKKRITPEAAVEQAPKKTIYFEKEKQTKYLKHNSSGSDSSVDIERSTEDEEVDLNKPKERAYEKSTDGADVTAGIYLRSQTNESKIIKRFLRTESVDNVLSLELTDDDEALFKDLFKTSVLRQAYGDACLKLVIRKCYRACKSAYKSSCQTISCKSELKRYFEKRSKKGCIDAFNASSKGDSLRRIVGPTTLNSGIMTREGYLSVACQTQIEKRTLIPQSNTTKSQNGEKLNILRDKYERACQKISQGRCGKACHYAQNATCVKFKCQKRLKKNFKKNCRTDCKLAYSSKAKKSSGSGSDDDSDSDSDDESDNDDDSDHDDDDDDDDDNGDDDDDES